MQIVQNRVPKAIDRDFLCQPLSKNRLGNKSGYGRLGFIIAVLTLNFVALLAPLRPVVPLLDNDLNAFAAKRSPLVPV